MAGNNSTLGATPERLFRIVLPPQEVRRRREIFDLGFRYCRKGNGGRWRETHSLRLRRLPGCPHC